MSHFFSRADSKSSRRLTTCRPAAASWFRSSSSQGCTSLSSPQINTRRLIENQMQVYMEEKAQQKPFHRSAPSPAKAGFIDVRNLTTKGTKNTQRKAGAPSIPLFFRHADSCFRRRRKGAQGHGKKRSSHFHLL